MHLELLQRTAEGCDYLADTWESLAQTLENQGFWSETEAKRALQLLGTNSPPKITDNTPLADFWRCVVSLLFKHQPAQTIRTYFQNSPEHTSPRSLPPAAEALATLLEFLTQHIADLESEAHTLWTTHDLPSRQSASARAAFDTTPEFTLLNRYLTAAERLRRQSLDELTRLRRAASSSTEPLAESAIANHPHSVPNEPATQTPDLPATARLQPPTSPIPNEPATTTPSPEPKTPKPLTPTLHPLLDDLLPPLPTFTTVPLTIGRPS